MKKKTLSDMQPGEKGRVLSVSGDNTVQRRIRDMGIVRGTEIEVVRRAPLGDPVEFRLKGYNLSLRKEEAACVSVEV
ncbi:MAG: Ferrous iron transporter, FeoA subunit domain protein [Candidatus Syntrophoarchaeum caldarius]|uniref:Ferrous iron transporter, FeoA subunit domain protein n=1 Tax=Candidatus Syntropharchaeum caldarium TaxID=1838285 RepID=A0A1F2P960_9EURY|nr:MAG: Ferrous iron transporter, FeoA subunit domain protein [Candidatus Syntrophoarchaeum caldarius]